MARNTTGPYERRFHQSFNRRVCTWRRTPKDVDGARRGVWCIVGRQHDHYVTHYFVRFDDGRVASRHKNEIYADPFHVVPFFGSESDLTLGFWWVNARHIAERPATSYEIVRSFVSDGCEAPSPGWTLCDGDSLVAARRARPIGGPVEVSETDAAELARKADKLRVRREKRAAHAEAMATQHERAERRHKKLAAKWRAVLVRAKKALEE